MMYGGEDLSGYYILAWHYHLFLTSHSTFIFCRICEDQHQAGLTCRNDTTAEINDVVHDDTDEWNDSGESLGLNGE